MNRLAGFLLLGTLATPLAAAPEIGWQEQFDRPDIPKEAGIYYEDRGSGKKGDAVVIREVSEGVLRVGLKFDPARRQDRLNVMFGDCVWGPPRKTGWGPFDLKRFPFVEYKWRGRGVTFYYGVQTLSGRRLGDYARPPVVRREKDEKGREWNVSVFRVAPDSSVPGPNTPVKLLGINLATYSPAQNDAITEIDYVRVRGFTPEEREREKKIVAGLKDFPRPGRWRGLDDFFPFGVYGVGYLRGDFEYWGGDYEGAFGVYCRHHLNFVASNDEIELGRFAGGRPGGFTKTWYKKGSRAQTKPSQAADPAATAYIGQMKLLIEAARATGMRLGADVRRMMDRHDPSGGYEQILPVARQLAGAFAEDGVVSAWAIADEPGADSLISLAWIIRALRRSDPLKRPELVVFNSPAKLAAFARYLSINYWDNYPVLQGRRNPWGIRDLGRQYRRLLPDRPMWVVLQSFETRPPTPKGSYTRPSAAEMRLMAYLALAEGAKGLIWYSGWMGSGRDEGLVDRTGLPRGDMLAVLSDLGRRLIPIGKLLLATDPLDAPDIQVRRTPDAAARRGITVSVLKDRVSSASYLVVINEDLAATGSASVTLPASILHEGQAVFDLYALDGQNLARKNVFHVSPLAPGDGRVYLVADAKRFQRDKTRILCQAAREAVRVLKPDLTIARRWKLPLAEVEAAVAAARRAADSGDSDDAQAQAARAERLLQQSIADHSELSATRRALSEIRQELAEVSRVAEYRSTRPRWWTGREHPMMVPNPAFLELSKRYWTVGRQYREAEGRYLKGRRQGLDELLARTRRQCLEMREAVLGMLRGKLKPTEEPSGHR